MVHSLVYKLNAALFQVGFGQDVSISINSLVVYLAATFAFQPASTAFWSDSVVVMMGTGR